MTPEEFEKKLEELVRNAPKGTTMFLTSSNNENKWPTMLFAQGAPPDIIYDMVQFARKEEVAGRILKTASIALKFV